MKITVLCFELARMIAETHRSVSKDKVRTTMCGICFDFTGNMLKLVATDTHRMSISTLPGIESEPVKFVLLTADVLAVKKILGRIGDCRITITDDAIAFRTQKGAHVAARNTHQFPNYARIIPADTYIHVICPRAELLSAFKEVMAGKPAIDRCRVTVNGTFAISGIPLDGAGVSSSAYVRWDRNPLGITEFLFAVNGKYAIDVIASIPGPTVRFQFMNTNLRPMIIDSPECTSQAFHIVMPMQLD